MEDYTKELVRLTEQSQELQRQIDATGLLKMKQGIDEAIAELKEKMKDAVEDGTLKTGKQTIKLGNGDVLTIEPRKGKTDVKVEDINLIESEYLQSELVERSGVLPDGTMYMLLDPKDGFFVDNQQVFKKEANLKLIQNLAKLGQAIPGVLVKKARPSIVLGLNGRTLK